MRVAYDDRALYVAARLQDREPAAIVRQLSRRDASVEADAFVVYLDPHHDHLTGAQFAVSAAGVQRDALIYNDSFLDSTWDAVWESAVAVGPGRLDGRDAHPALAAALPEGGPPHVGHQRAADHPAAQRVGLAAARAARTSRGWPRGWRTSRASRASGPPTTLEWLPYVTSRAEFIAPAAAGLALQRRLARSSRRRAST